MSRSQPTESKATAATTPAPVVPIEPTLSMQDLAVALVKHYGLHEGEYDLMVEFNIGTGAVGPNPAVTSPGIMIGLARVGLAPAPHPGPTTVNAAEVNPAAPAAKKSSTRTKKAAAA